LGCCARAAIGHAAAPEPLGLNFTGKNIDSRRVAARPPSPLPAPLREIPQAARAIGLQIHIVNARTGREIEEAFASLAREQSDGESPSGLEEYDAVS
jgi:hypothetical protein